MRTAPFDAVVVGAGPAGLATGLAFAELGLSTALVGPLADPNDGRTAALFQGSINFLKRIGAWGEVAPRSEPIEAIRLCDATNTLFRAPEVTFSAREIGFEAFGYNVPTAGLTAALEKAANGRVARIATATKSVTVTEAHVELVTTDDIHISAPLVAAADGRNSSCRQAAGIAMRTWAYPQSAVVATFSHTRDHGRVSTELHRRAGPLTVVPMPGKASSLVWVETPQEAQQLAALSESDFAAVLGSHIGGLLGTLSGFSPRRVYPLSGQTAQDLGYRRVGLIGEAGHIIPPIGAQGLNLSFRDAATLAELAAAAKSHDSDPGAASLLKEYDRRRRADVTSRVWSIDLMNRSLLSEMPPVQFARVLGLFALKTIGPLRHLVMREGMTPSFATPQLMEPLQGATAT